MRIQHNIMAMNSYRNYTGNTSALSKNLEKLSSGYKINRAGDDAAGLAISEKMRAQITGLKTAQKNAKDGISLVQTAEGALTEVHSMLNRMVELADQSANGTYDNLTDRANLQKEFDALRTEIDRIADSTNFNGINLLDGSKDAAVVTKSVEITTTGRADHAIVAAGTVPGTNTIVHAEGKAAKQTTFTVELDDLNFKVDADNAANTVTLSVGDADITTAKLAATTDTAGLASAFATAASTGVSIDGVTYSVKAEGDKLVFTMDKAWADAATSSASFSGNFAVSVTSGAASASLEGHVNVGTQNITVGNVETKSTLANTIGTTAMANGDIVDGAGLKIGDTTYVFALKKETLDTDFGAGYKVVDLTSLADADGDFDTTKANALTDALGKITAAAADNDMFTVGFDNAKKLTLQEKSTYTGNADLTSKAEIQKLVQKFTKVSATEKETITGGDGTALTLQIGDTSDPFNQIQVSIKDIHAKALGIDGSAININNQNSAAAAVDILKKAINSVSSTRGDLGALQNRLDHTINNLSVMQENIQDAEASIRDVDVAEEMMAYTKNNILVQSAQAMLAQANQVPQGVLQLLQ